MAVSKHPKAIPCGHFRDKSYGMASVQVFFTQIKFKPVPKDSRSSKTSHVTHWYEGISPKMSETPVYLEE